MDGAQCLPAVFTALCLLGLWFQYSSDLLKDFGPYFNTQECSIPHFHEVLSGKGNFQAVGSALVICKQIFQATSGKYRVDFREGRGNTCIWLLQSIRKMILLAWCRGSLPWEIGGTGYCRTKEKPLNTKLLFCHSPYFAETNLLCVPLTLLDFKHCICTE